MTLTVLMSFLAYAITHVFSMRSGKKMVWVYTGPNITFMTDEMTFWDLSFKVFVCSSVCIQNWVFCAAKLQLPVSSLANCPCPQPAATVWLGRHLLHEAIKHQILPGLVRKKRLSGSESHRFIAASSSAIPFFFRSK